MPVASPVLVALALAMGLPAPAHATDAASAAATGANARGEANPAEPPRGPTPTGRSGDQQHPAADPASLRAAHRIRRAIDADERLADAEITVTPTHGKVLLQGRVRSAADKAALQHTATRAATRANIDFQIDVIQ